FSLLSTPTSSPSHIYTLSLHDALPICPVLPDAVTITISPAFASSADISSKYSSSSKASSSIEPVYQPMFSGVLWPAFYNTSHIRSEEHTSELQSRFDLVCRLLLEKKKI